MLFTNKVKDTKISFHWQGHQVSHSLIRDSVKCTVHLTLVGIKNCVTMESIAKLLNSAKDVGICDPNVQGVIEDYFDVNNFYSDCSDTDSEEELDLERGLSTANDNGAVPVVPVNMEDNVTSEFDDHFVGKA